MWKSVGSGGFWGFAWGPRAAPVCGDQGDEAGLAIPFNTKLAFSKRKFKARFNLLRNIMAHDSQLYNCYTIFVDF